MYAIIQTGGKQYRVEEGKVITVEKLAQAADEAIEFADVLSVVDGDNIQFGAPFVKGATVKGKVLTQGRGKKIRVFKYKSKSNYRRRQGHRQPFTKVLIESIALA
ncbi:MAG: 50S ribosomal protein L21 [Negativicoccus massiliensis]|uniref:50S ribosomal protein L21 n=1 Tax=Negativicoccus succinicivorans TaxID=620903 RepID=UPI0026EABA81|nr:50S ribosomal protein L21 [Negativicoccus succinicivorans]MDU4641717.1 50S ribosomal protein L21 [Negativicoccus massiliensis]MBS5887494.1 50S ribosomal protein L21 [Negativicoccus succinicivorans]MBS6027911.1 50S ribosomal protein L21 [Negativicoccus succinicivorans]MDU2417016.1 50S ribosomal protein L21 [Negativicoccus succinicivorans]MDU3214739.1 50S ribosomal protein L21 [Negativicoccus succinicivorans]